MDGTFRTLSTHQLLYATAMDSLDLRLVAAAAVTILAVATPFLLGRQQNKPSPSDAAATDTSDAATATSDAAAATEQQRKKPKKRPKKAAAAAHDEAEEDEATLSAALPELTVGQKVWHRQTGETVVVAKVYYDDLPPYYAVRTANGTERSTVRMRLETEDERAAAVAANELRAAEERAEAAAAELLAEEATAASRKGSGKPNSRPSSGREAKGAKKR